MVRNIVTAVAVWFATAVGSLAAEPDVKVKVTAADGPVLKLDGKPISQPNMPINRSRKEFACYVRFRDPAATVPRWGPSPELWPMVNTDFAWTKKPTFEAKEGRFVESFAWGEVARVYRAVPGGMDVEVTVHNTSSKTLCEFQQNLLTLKLPGDTGPAMTNEAVYFGGATPAHSGNTLSGPLALPLVTYVKDEGSFSRAIVATTPEAKRHLALSWETDTWVPPWERKRKLTGYAVNDPVAMELALRQQEKERAAKGETWWLKLSVGGDRLLYHDRYASRPIPPGGSDTYVVWLRFGDADDPLAPAKEALEAYGKARPMRFSWPDRRPIVPSMVGDKFPFREPQGLELQRPAVGPRGDEVRKLMLDHADALIARMKTLDAQGMIVWNIEGSEASQIKYVGDPRMIEYMCPEADAVADEFFKRIRDAGFKVGVCLRPSVITVGELAKSPWLKAANPKATTPYAFFHEYPHTVRSPAEILIEKVEYAKKRWGCTLFYVDTNHAAGFTPQTDEEKATWPKNPDGSFKWYHELLNEDVWAEVLERHPDVLFTIEHTPMIQYTVNAPYDDGLAGLSGTPPVVRATWPEAFKCVSGLGGHGPDNFWKWVDRSTKGDVVLGGGPFDLPEFLGAVAAVAAYQKAGPPAELATLDPQRLLAAAVDAQADGRLRFHAARQVCAGMPDAATVDKLLAGKDRVVQMLAIESLSSRDQLTPQIPRLIKLPGGRYGFFGATLRDATRRGGPEFLDDLTEYAHSHPADAQSVVNIFSMMPGPVGAERLALLIGDAKLPDNARMNAGGALGSREDASAAQKDAALAYLLPLLGDAKRRTGAAGIVHAAFVGKKGLWRDDPRVLEAAKTALAAERAQPKPDTAFVAVLEKIVDRRQ